MSNEELAEILRRCLVPIRSWGAWIQNAGRARELRADIERAIIELKEKQVADRW